MLGVDFIRRLESAPPVKAAVIEMFEQAQQTSPDRFYLSILDVETIHHDAKRYFAVTDIRHRITQEFAEYFTDVTQPTDDNLSDHHKQFIRRLHLLAYSQFWECRSIQRLLGSLAATVCGKEYQPTRYIDHDASTKNVYEKIISDAKKAGLTIAQLLTAIYSNQIRNAFAHSQFWTAGPYVCFENYASENPEHVTSLTVEHWSIFFERFRDLVIALFQQRLEGVRELRRRLPYTVSLPEFASPVILGQDDRGYWFAKPVKRLVLPPNVGDMGL